jgi:hypothetical protein
MSTNSSDIYDEASRPLRSQNKDDHIFYDDLLSSAIAIVGPIGAGVFLYEAVLIPGILLGIATIAATKHTGDVKSTFYPVVKSTLHSVHTTSQHAKEFIAETQERMQDILAEIEADQGHNSVNNASTYGPIL